MTTEPIFAELTSRALVAVGGPDWRGFLNNLLTYRDQRLKGTALLMGWLSFNLVCAIGAAANIGIADWMFVRHTSWVFSAVTGVLISVVWNYAMSSLFTWRRW